MCTDYRYIIIVENVHRNFITICISYYSMFYYLQKRDLEGAFWFAVLLNLKHIYLYVAPAYFIYLLRSYCLSSYPNGGARFTSYSLGRFLKLGFTVSVVFTISFAPFIFHLPQVSKLIRHSLYILNCVASVELILRMCWVSPIRLSKISF